MDWVKLAATYYLDPKVAALPDAEAETMFLRGIAYCGAAESDGFIPAGVLLALGRRAHRRSAAALTAAGLWQPVDGGWLVVRWTERQAELMQLIGRRRRDADRKRRVRGQSADSPGNHPRNVAPSESESESESDLVVKSLDHPHSRNARDDDDLDLDLEAITQAIGAGGPDHARRVARDVLDRATTTPKNPTGYTLEAIRREPDRYRPTPTAPTLRDLCDHGRHHHHCPYCTQEATA